MSLHIAVKLFDYQCRMFVAAVSSRSYARMWYVLCSNVTYSDQALFVGRHHRSIPISPAKLLSRSICDSMCLRRVVHVD